MPGGAVTEVPPWVRATALDLLLLQEPRATVADVVFDSLLDEPGHSAVRTVRFRSADGRVVHVDVVTRATGLSMSVRVEPRQDCYVTLRGTTALALMSAVAAGGVLRMHDLPSGLMSLVFEPALFDVGPTLRTAWLRY